MKLTKLIHPETGEEVIVTASGIDALHAKGYRPSDDSAAKSDKKKTSKKHDKPETPSDDSAAKSE